TRSPPSTWTRITTRVVRLIPGTCGDTPRPCTSSPFPVVDGGRHDGGDARRARARGSAPVPGGHLARDVVVGDLRGRLGGRVDEAHDTRRERRGPQERERVVRPALVEEARARAGRDVAHEQSPLVVQPGGEERARHAYPPVTRDPPQPAPTPD